MSAVEAQTDKKYLENNSSIIIGLMESLVNQTDLQSRKDDDPFFYLIDHCFQVKGKGTVVTGTVLQGRIKKGDDIELPEIGFKNKVKSMQMFHKDINEVHRGDRVGMLIN